MEQRVAVRRVRQGRQASCRVGVGGVALGGAQGGVAHREKEDDREHHVYLFAFVDEKIRSESGVFTSTLSATICQVLKKPGFLFCHNNVLAVNCVGTIDCGCSCVFAIVFIHLACISCAPFSAVKHQGGR